MVAYYTNTLLTQLLRNNPMRSTQEKMFENIYDLIKGGTFEEEARKELNQYLRGKNIAWDGDNNTIHIGKKFTLMMVTE